MKKRVLTIILALAMLITLGVSVFAAPENPIAPNKGNLTIHKYITDDSFVSPGVPGNGKKIESDLPTGAVPLGGVHFDVYKIGNPDTGNADAIIPKGGDGVTYNLMTSDPGSPPPGINQLPYLVVAALPDYGTVYYNLTPEGQSGKTDTAGELKLTDLDRGYYLVVENAAESEPKIDGNPTSISNVVDPFVVAVPMTDTAGTGWNDNVHVYPKNPPLTIQKTVDKQTVSVGGTLEYTITLPKIPTTIDPEVAEYFTITDTLHEALKLSTELSNIMIVCFNSALADINLNMTGGNGALTSFNFESTYYDYYVSYNDPKGEGGDETDNTLTINLTKQGIVKLNAAMEEDTSNKVVGLKVSFDTIVNKSILDIESVTDQSTYHTVGNTAKVEFKNDGNIYMDESDEVLTDTGEIVVNKLGDSNAPLAGAKFILGRTSIPEGEEESKTEYCMFAGDGNVSWVDEMEGATEIETTIISNRASPFDEMAVAIFSGIERHNSADLNVYYEYFVIETEAPENYNLLGKSVPVNFASADTDKGALSDDGLTSTITVKNSTGFILPITGGMGTILFTIIGITLVGTAAILVIFTRKKKTDTE